MDLPEKVCGSNCYCLSFLSSPSSLKWGRRGTGGKPVCFRPAPARGIFIPFCSRCNDKGARARDGRPQRPSQPVLYKLSVEVQVGVSGTL